MTSQGFTRKRLTGFAIALVLAVALPPAIACAQGATEEKKVQEMVNAVSQDVSRLRGLKFKSPVSFRLAGREEMEKLLLGEMENQWPRHQLEADERTFKVLGLLPTNYDLRKELLATYGEQVIGLYDPESKEMVLVKNTPLKGLARIVLSHELTHALQAQHFDIAQLVAESTHTLDRDFAISATIEGDATAVMSDYVTENAVGNLELLMEALQVDVMASNARLLGAPPFMRHTVLSPYLYGMAFINHFRTKGWEEIDRIYGDFPLSAEQVMHPEKYYPRRDFPQRIDVGEEFRRGRTAHAEAMTDTTLGEIGVLALVESWGEVLADDELKRSAAKVAAGWDGDRLISAQSVRDGAIELYWISTWDTPEDAQEMADALKKWTGNWEGKNEDRAWSRYTRVWRPEVDGKPGSDVVCLMVRTQGKFAGGLERIPPYTTKVIRTAADLALKN